MKLYSVIVNDSHNGWINTICVLKAAKRDKKCGYITKDITVAKRAIENLSKQFPHASYTLIETVD